MTGNNYINSKIPMSAYTDGIEVFHVVYTSYKDVYILSYIDEFGIEQEKEVTADYELLPELGDISISKEWYTCKIQGYKVTGSALSLLPEASKPLPSNILSAVYLTPSSLLSISYTLSSSAAACSSACISCN